MLIGKTKTATGGQARLWPVLLALLLAVLVPTGCVLWFMNEALEQPAVRRSPAAARRVHR